MSAFHLRYTTRMQHDRPPNVTRHGALGAIAALGATLSGVPALACVVAPEIEEGPFFIDERLNRSDLTGGTQRPGVVAAIPLRLTLRVEGLRGSACEPLAGAQVDLWHADATGVYSDEAVMHTHGERFLRGYQTTGADGIAAFTTVFPGWYPGRAPHIHVKVRTYTPRGDLARTFTSQLFFDEAATNAVFANGLYAARGPMETPNARDNYFDRRTLVPLKRGERGYAGTFTFAMRTGA